MRPILIYCKAMICAAAFVAVLVPWTVAYCLGPRRLADLLDGVLVWIVNQWPEG